MIVNDGYIINDGEIIFSPIVGMMIQSDELIFFRGVGQPPIRLVDPENKPFLVETSLPSPMTARVYVNLPQGILYRSPSLLYFI